MRIFTPFGVIRMRSLCFLVVMGLWAAPRCGSALQLPPTEPIEGFGIVNAFPGLRFDQPVSIVAIPRDTNRLFVVERPGRIVVITNLATPNKTVFLDLRGDTRLGSIETGLLGLTFHPGFSTNRQFFVFRTKTLVNAGSSSSGRLVLSRFLAANAPSLVGIPDSETVLFTQEDDTETHNGGDLQFGPDGYLYITTGEHPVGLPASRNLSRLDAGLFGVLRIDVDRRPENPPPNPHAAATTHYSIPVDNPFVGRTRYLGEDLNPLEVRTELFALGFRNPWRLHIDSASGLIYAADVGSNRAEEINLVEAGGNYGWPYRESDFSYALPESADFTPRPPLWSGVRGWGADQAECVVGGVVYHGSQLPGLKGAYLFGDYLTGHIRALRHDAHGLTDLHRLTGVRTGVSSFGYDPRDGEVLITQVVEGKILKLVYKDPAALEVPRSLAGVGAFQDLLHLLPTPELLPYQINVPFWSDNAIKRRWVDRSGAQSPIGIPSSGGWELPTGMVWIKHFEMEMIRGEAASIKRLETRFLVKTDEGIYGLTYRWNGDGTDAQLVGPDGDRETLSILEDGIPRQQEWHYPSRQDCLHCHSVWGGYALGFNPSQLNRDVQRGEESHHQLTDLNRAGYFKPALSDPKAQRRLARLEDAAFPVEYRVRSYLEANCIPCHNPGQPSLVAWNAQMSTPLTESGIVDGHVVVPGHPSQSWLMSRISSPRSSSGARMPPLLSTLLDTNFVDQTRSWITFMPQPPWVYGDLGNPLLPGASSISNGLYRVAGSLSDPSMPDGAQFLSRPVAERSIQLVAKVVDCAALKSGSVAGVSLRAGRETGAPFAAALLDGRCRGTFQFRVSSDGPVETLPFVTTPAMQWVRLQREGDEFRGFASQDGTHWIPTGTARIPLEGAMQAGLVTSSRDIHFLAQATFENFSLLSVSVKAPSPRSRLAELQPLHIQPAIELLGGSVREVEFRSNGQRLGTVSSPPYDFTWLYPDSGLQRVEVEVIDSTGARLRAAPVEVEIETPRARGVRTESPQVLNGAWKNSLGSLGYWLAGEARLDTGRVHLDWRAGEPSWTDHGDSDSRSLVRSSGLGRVAASWSGEREILLDMKTSSSQLYRISLYSVDWSSTASQRVEWLDPGSGAVLDSREWVDFAGGIWDSWAFRGSVRLRVIGLEGTTPQLSAVFIDPAVNLPPTVRLSEPRNHRVQRLPAPLDLVAIPQDPDNTVARVEFRAGERLLGSRVAPPWSMIVTNLLAGTYEISCRAWDALGDWSDSGTANVTLTLPPAAAGFVGEDRSTRGAWPGRYGQMGWLLPSDSRWPTEVDLTFAAVASNAGPAPGDALDFPLKPGSDERSRDLFVSPVAGQGGGSNTLSFTLGVLDGGERLLSAYFYRPGLPACLDLRLTDATSGRLLDARPVFPQENGIFLSWLVRGRVRLEIVSRCSPAFLTGLFLDGDTQTPSPTIGLTRPLPGYVNTTPAVVRLEANAHSQNGPIAKVEFFANDIYLGEALGPPFAQDWTVTSAGDYEVWGRAYDITGHSTDSAAASVSVRWESPTQAKFVGMDRDTRGGWIGHYGSTGWDIAGVNSQWPTEVEKSVSLQTLFVWNPTSYNDNALVRPEDYLRAEAVWYSRKLPLTVRLKFKDASSHRVALYLASFYEDHQVHVDLYNARSKALLDSRDFLHVQTPGYALWDVQGDVEFQLRPPAAFPQQDLVWYSGIFLDPGPGPFADWRRAHFTPNEMEDPQQGGEDADPDGDRLSNLAEYGFGKDPKRANASSGVTATVEDGILKHVFRHDRKALQAQWQLDFSGDLEQWTPAPASVVEVDSDDRFETVTTSFSLQAATSGQIFVRLRWSIHYLQD